MGHFIYPNSLRVLVEAGLLEPDRVLEYRLETTPAATWIHLDPAHDALGSGRTHSAPAADLMAQLDRQAEDRQGQDRPRKLCACVDWATSPLAALAPDGEHAQGSLDWLENLRYSGLGTERVANLRRSLAAPPPPCGHAGIDAVVAHTADRLASEVAQLLEEGWYLAERARLLAHGAAGWNATDADRRRALGARSLAESDLPGVDLEKVPDWTPTEAENLALLADAREVIAELSHPQLWVRIRDHADDYLWAYLNAIHPGGVALVPAALLTEFRVPRGDVLGPDRGYDPAAVARAADLACGEVDLGDLLTALDAAAA